MEKHEKILNFEKKMKKKSFGYGKKNFGSDTDTKIQPWFRFPIPIPNYGQTLSWVLSKQPRRKSLLS